MIEQFAARSPKVATTLIYVGGYLAGSLLGMLVDYLISGAVKTGAAGLRSPGSQHGATQRVGADTGRFEPTHQLVRARRLSRRGAEVTDRSIVFPIVFQGIGVE